MANKQCEIGMVGLGVMGRNLLLNMADHGFSVAGYDNDAKQAGHLTQESQGRDIHATTDIKEFVSWLRAPRAIVLLVPAGAAVDAVINALLPHLDKGDLIIDAGNSYFKDTDHRARQLSEQNIQFLGVGVSGGEEGARRGPSIMPGGAAEAYQRVQPVFEAIAAKVKGEACVAYMGPGSAGHFVKMVHNGIEYGLMQLISETYELMKRGLGFSNTQLQNVYAQWNKTELNSYLLEITQHIFGKKDDKTDQDLIDVILPVASQKGTGMWTSQSALELQSPTPTIDIAVAIRDLSMLVDAREEASEIYPAFSTNFSGDSAHFVEQLRHALYAATIIVYAQGMALLSTASEKYQYDLELSEIAKIWRGGCIIRAQLLEDIREAFHNRNDLLSLLIDPQLSRKISEFQPYLRQVIIQAVTWGIPVPGLASALNYFDVYRSARLPANLIQAQRDYFGAHTYQRTDMPGIFHTEWEKP
jgi:6-phosphogluconate dehydrogenase